LFYVGASGGGQGKELLGVPSAITRGEFPPGGMPRSGEIDEAPLNGGRHGRPVSPHAVLDGAVEVEQEERHDVDHSGLGDGGLAPGLEGGRGVGRLDAVGLGCARVLAQGGDCADLVVEVVGEIGLEAIHNLHELGAREVGWRRKA
jgi:hypothetical protein